MKLGIFLNTYSHQAGASVHQENVEQVQLMEQLGYDFALIGERHQRTEGNAEPVTALAWLLAHTKSLQIGTGGFIVPVHQPFRLAEQAAYLDVLSRGRLIFGAVLGYYAGDFDPFGVDRRERVSRFVESLEIMRRLWSGGPVTYRGQHYALDQALISPVPVQKNGPPVWIGAKVEAAIRRSATHGDVWFPSATEDFESLPPKIEVYRHALAEAGKRDGEIILLRDGFVAESSQKARTIVEGPMLRKYSEYLTFKTASPDADRYGTSFDAAASKLVVGSPQECVDALGRYAELGVAGVALRCQFPGLPHAEVLKCIERVGTHVLPKVRT